MSGIFDTIHSGNLEELKRIVAQNPEYIHLKIISGWNTGMKWSLLDVAIEYGKLEIAKYLWEMDGRPNDKNYRNNIFTPVHRAARDGHTKTLEWVFAEKVLPLRVLIIKDYNGFIPLDRAIAEGRLEMAKFLWEKNRGQLNFSIYRNQSDTPVTRAAEDGHTKTLKWLFTEKVLPRSALNIQHINAYNPLDRAIACGKLETAKCLWEMGGRPNPKIYCDGNQTPMHCAAHRTTLEWVFTEKVLPLDVLKIKNRWKRTPLDEAIACGNLEAAKFLFEKGGRPNLDEVYCDKVFYNGKWIPVHRVAQYGCTNILEWIFAEGVLPLRVLNIQNEWKMTPLDIAIAHGNLETAALLQRLMYFNPVFLAMQRAKRDHHRTLLRRLPNELLDMVVDEVAARFRIKVEW